MKNVPRATTPNIVGQALDHTVNTRTCENSSFLERISSTVSHRGITDIKTAKNPSQKVSRSPYLGVGSSTKRYTKVKNTFKKPVKKQLSVKEPSKEFFSIEMLEKAIQELSENSCK